MGHYAAFREAPASCTWQEVRPGVGMAQGLRNAERGSPVSHHQILDHPILDQPDPEGIGPFVEEIVVIAAIIMINAVLIYLLLQ